jgi:glycosyltransferase involved in cell wall biosynthesis
MKFPPLVYMLVLSGRIEEAQRVAKSKYAGCELISLSKRSLREGGWRRQLRELRKLKGEAFLVFAESVEDIQEPLLLKLTIMFHRCKSTIIADTSGYLEVFARRDRWKLLPEVLIATAADTCVFFLSWVTLQVLGLRTTTPRDNVGPPGVELAVLYPFPPGRLQDGGAMSHIAGFLSGLTRCSASCEIFSGQTIVASSFPAHEIRYRRRFYIFRESLAVSYSLRLAKEAGKELMHRVPLFVYQRHGRYVAAGALLSRRLRRPLVLEYNGSEVWIAKHWDPSRFVPWLRLCEDISLKAAALITVVSDALRKELIDRGIPQHKILVNPNGVDPDIFYPHCGGNEIRSRLGLQPSQVTIGFIGSFSYWHGIGVLQEAIHVLLREQASDAKSPELRFILIGDGPLSPEIREALQPYCKRGWVIFTGRLPHDRAPQYLDAADILISPHVPMPDGTPFFGSPTKIFEYMAMGKAIVASNLDQLARVLTHQQTAWLVEPGNAGELAEAIRLLAARPETRRYLGETARNIAVTHHTWQQNAARVLSRLAELERPRTELTQSQAA